MAPGPLFQPTTLPSALKYGSSGLVEAQALWEFYQALDALPRKANVSTHTARGPGTSSQACTGASSHLRVVRPAHSQQTRPAHTLRLFMVRGPSRGLSTGGSSSGPAPHTLSGRDQPVLQAWPKPTAQTPQALCGCHNRRKAERSLKKAPQHPCPGLKLPKGLPLHSKRPSSARTPSPGWHLPYIRQPVCSAPGPLNRNPVGCWGTELLSVHPHAQAHHECRLLSTLPAHSS